MLRVAHNRTGRAGGPLRRTRHCPLGHASRVHRYQSACNRGIPIYAGSLPPASGAPVSAQKTLRLAHFHRSFCRQHKAMFCVAAYLTSGENQPITISLDGNRKEMQRSQLSNVKHRGRAAARPRRSRSISVRSISVRSIYLWKRVFIRTARI